MAEIVNTNQFRNGMHIEHRGSMWRIVEFQHVKPGKGGAFVRTKLKNLETGAVVEDTFRAGEKFARVHTEVKNVQFLYDDGSDAHFMDEESYEQFALPRGDIADELAYMLPSSTVQILQVNGKPSGLQMPASVELAVAETEPGVAGDTVSNVTKPATLETGAVVQVPLFVDMGERIKVDPREARYISSRRLTRSWHGVAATAKRAPQGSAPAEGGESSVGSAGRILLASKLRVPQLVRHDDPAALAGAARRPRPDRRGAPDRGDPRPRRVSRASRSPVAACSTPPCVAGSRVRGSGSARSTRGRARRSGSRSAAGSSSARSPSRRTSSAASSPAPPTTGSRSSGCTTP